MDAAIVMGMEAPSLPSSSSSGGTSGEEASGEAPEDMAGFEFQATRSV